MMLRPNIVLGLAAACLAITAHSGAEAKKKKQPEVQQVAPIDLTALDEAIRANRLVQAKTLLEQSQLARQSGPMLDLLKAEYDLARGQNDVALAGFRLLVADIGVGARAHQGAGIASIRINRIDDAIGYLSAATKAYGSLWRAWSALGVAHDLKRNWQAAEAAFASGLAARPNAGEILANRGYSRLLQKRFAEALHDLKQAHGLLPGNERIETNLRLALALNGSYDDAIGISASDTELVKNLNNAGYAAWLQGDFVAARAYLSRAMEISDVYYDRAANNLAAVNAASGK